MVSCMCIFSGRSNSTTKGPLTSPKAMCPETRSEWMERSLSAPPRAAMTLARISSAVCAAAATGSKQRIASPSAFVFMKFMVAVLEAGGLGPERRGTETPRRKLEQRWHPHPGCLRKSGKERTCATRSAQEWQAKDLQRGIFALWCNGRVPEGVCHPGCFGKRVRKLLKTKGRGAKKSGKRV